jgi:hypothetical protein
MNLERLETYCFPFVLTLCCLTVARGFAVRKNREYLQTTLMPNDESCIGLFIFVVQP